MPSARKILGIHDGHNSSAALLVEGKLLAAVQEERFTYVKNEGGMPLRCLEALDKKFGLSDVDATVLSSKYLGNSDWSRSATLENYADSTSLTSLWRQTLKRSKFVFTIYQRVKQRGRHASLPPILNRSKVTYLDHHEAHAASAYYGAGASDQKVLVCTCDGAGDGLCASSYIGVNGNLVPLLKIDEQHSIGRVYSFVTFLFHMVPYEHEYKIMGLAPYCTDEDKILSCSKEFEALFSWHGDYTQWRYSGGLPSVQAAGKEIQRIFSRYRFDVVSAGLQRFIETHLIRWIAALVKRTGIRSIALAGGVFMNVKANQLIAELPEIDKCFVFPSCGDETLSIGAAYHGWQKITGMAPDRLSNFYLWDETLEFSPQLLADKNVTTLTPSDLNLEVARLLAKGEIVGVVRGPMEFGARALGNRSILADPTSPNVAQRINESIKCRDFWMPFAPALLDTDFDQYFYRTNSVSNYEYMVFTARSRQEALVNAFATLHSFDHTGRPQSVTSNTNPDFAEVISEFKKLTGRAIILNTSYNLHGFPIVRDSLQALDVFFNSDLNHLVLGNMLISKNETNQKGH